MPQLTYALEISGPGFEGDLADSRPMHIRGYRNDAGAELPYGRFVTKSANADNLGMKLPAAGEVLLGILAHDHSEEKQTTGLLDKRMGNVVAQGRVVVKVENAVTPASAVLVRIDSGGNGAGSVRAGAAVGGSLVALTNARFLGSAAINGLVVLEFEIPPVPTLA